MTPSDIESLQKLIASRDPDDPLRRLVIRLSLKEQKNAIHMANSAPPRAPASARLNRQRFRRRKLAEAAARLTGSSRPPISKDVLAVRFSPHPVLDSLVQDRRARWKPVLRRVRAGDRLRVSIDRLSFLDDPVATIDCLKAIAELETHSLDAQLDFSFDYVEDIAPFLVMSEFWPHLAPVFSTGGSMTPAVQKVIAAVGLNHRLGMAFPRLDSLQDVWALPVQRRRESGKSRSPERYLEPQTVEKAADGLVDAINTWFAAADTGAELTPQGRSNVKGLVTEILDNAERHSSYEDRDGSWSLAAFMARRDVGGEERFVCHFAILSLGATIAESLDATAGEEMKDKLDGFVHALRMSKARQSRQTLITLAALQDGVTRDDRAFSHLSGGYGLMTFVDSVNILGLTNRAELAPQIAILSGRSCIRMRSPYIRGERKDGQEIRKQFFNASNSVGEPPDEAFVYDLPVHFPGTVISAGFTLDPEFYRNMLNGND